MSLEQVEVAARWELDGRFEIRRFAWRGQVFTVESTGRQWEDETGLHVLCMVPGGQVFELVFHLNPAGWMAIPPSGSLGLA